MDIVIDEAATTVWVALGRDSRIELPITPDTSVTREVLGGILELVVAGEFKERLWIRRSRVLRSEGMLNGEPPRRLRHFSFHSKDSVDSVEDVQYSPY